MGWPFSKQNNIETKENPSGASFFVSAPISWAKWSDPRKYITEGYQQNVLVYRSIKEIVTAAKSIEFELYNGDTLVQNHPVIDLLKTPTPTLSWGEWLTEMLVNYLVTGEMFCVAAPESRPVELWPLNPVNMKIQAGTNGIARGYIHEAGTAKQTYPVDPDTGHGQCFFTKMYNPNDYWRGQSPLMAAALSADTHNAGARWNFSLLKNGARPSGLVKMTGGMPSQSALQNLREYFKRAIQGENNAGEVPILAEGAEWQQLSQSPQDMDFSTTMAVTAKHIAAAYGVPLPLIDNDASTFNNIEQAKERLYTDTVMPLLAGLLDEISRWLFPMFGIEGYELRIDKDSISALDNMRQRMFDRAVSAYGSGLITIEEARKMMGFEETPKGQLRESNDLGQDDVKALAYGLDL